jgi:hypothetical protein
MKTTSLFDTVAAAKGRISDWLHDLRVAGAGLPGPTKQQLLDQLASADPVTRRDGSLELVLPGLSSLGVGIFQRSFDCDSVRIRVVPYGNS